jgi:branched-chain amino acid transport system ATP-binding protein
MVGGRPFRRAWLHAQSDAGRLKEALVQTESAAPPPSTPTLPLPELTQTDPQPCDRIALSLQGVTKRFGSTEIIRGVDMDVHQGERIALIGPNGAGKSTLFNLISGRLAPSAGHIRLSGQDVTGFKPQHIHRLGLARSFQITHIFHRMTVFENLRCSVMWNQGHGYAFWRDIEGLQDARDRAEQLLRDVRLEHRRHELAMNLTYAEQRALELGITLGGGSGVILLDEPTAGMSRAETAYMIDLIRRLTHGKTLVMVEHDMDVVFGLADRVAVLVYGQVIAFDTPARVKADPAVRSAYLGQDPGAEATC